jgi:hypothetical protein
MNEHKKATDDREKIAIAKEFKRVMLQTQEFCLKNRLFST